MQPLYEQQIWKVHNFPMIVIRSQELKITYYCEFCFIGYLIFPVVTASCFFRNFELLNNCYCNLQWARDTVHLVLQVLWPRVGVRVVIYRECNVLHNLEIFVNRDSYCDYVITNILDYILENIVKILQYTQGCQWFWYIEFCIGNQFVFPKRGI